MLSLDHIAITAPDLATGVAHTEAQLGMPLGPGGQHPDMGTHNRLLSLGPDFYMEVISIDPNAPAPARTRWFDLDSGPVAPSLSHWICRTPDLPAALARAPAGTGTPLSLSRAHLRWQMAVPDTGRLPFDDTHPALISWQSAPPVLPDSGARLAELIITHPQADALAAQLALNDPRVRFETGPAKALRAIIDTPNGQRILQ